MIAQQIARALGAAHRSGAWWRARCPVHCSRSATLALRDGSRGLVVYCHAGCSRAEIFADLCRRGLIGSAPEYVSTGTSILVRDDPAPRIALARCIWESAQDARYSPVAVYLASRGITITPPSSLRYAAKARHPDGRSEAAMIARVDGPDGRLVGVHRTYLTPDWHRRDRASLGPIAGGAVRLGKLERDLPLVIAEGIESALAAAQLTGWPAWAALSAVGIERLIVPPEARNIVIAADHDPSGTGERAARRAAMPCVREGRRVRIIIPVRIGADPNDLLGESVDAG
jgi:putative DNA primase/helicase